MGAQGYINNVGRLKHTIIRGGENLFPAEIEEFLVRHPHLQHDELSQHTQGGRYGRQRLGPARSSWLPPGQDIVDLRRNRVLVLASLLLLGPFRADRPQSGRACWLCRHGQRGGWAAGWTLECWLWLHCSKTFTSGKLGAAL